MPPTKTCIAIALGSLALYGTLLARPAASPSKKPVHPPNLPIPAEAAARSQPAMVKAGSWQGSWYYSDRSSRLAFWFDGVRGKMKVRYRYELKGGGEGEANGFGDSGETGTGRSSAGTGPGKLQLTWKVDPDGILRGRIVRSWPDGKGTGEVIESNDFEAWRINDGEELYLFFKNTVQEHRAGEATSNRENIPDQAFTLRKMTDEIVYWEELIG